ncbi:MAG: hypothetical protein R3B09_18415 [Nannocystaceae bacterium]
MSLRRLPFRSSWRLTQLFAAQAELLELDQGRLVRDTGLHKEMVRRALGHNVRLPDHVPSAYVSMVMADALRLDRDFVARLRERDELAALQGEPARKGEAATGTQSTFGREVVAQRIAELNAELTAHHPIAGTAWPLASAFSRQRAQREVSIDALVPALVNDPAAQKRLRRALHRFEAGTLQIDEDNLRTWVTALGSLGPPALAADGLRERARADAEYTFVDGDHLDRVELEARAKIQVHDGASIPGASFRYRRAPLPLPRVVVESLEATYADPPAPRRGVRLIGARHHGYEIGIVTAGAILLTVKRTAFAVEGPLDAPEFKVGVDGVVAHQELRPGDVVFFNSGRFHRAEFLGPGRVVVVNLRHSAVRTTI